jgi:D-ribose pyranose/furanose isomerase RbsD
MPTAESLIVEAPESEVFAELKSIELEVDRLVERYAQVAPIVREELASRRKVLKSRASSPEVKQELQLVEDHITKLDKELQSQLVTMEVFRGEAFWSAVRFGGLGLLVGWGLKAWIS